MATVGRALLGFLALTLAGCAKDADASLAAIRSWVATSRLAGESWSAGLIPTPYTERTLQAAEEGIAEAAKDLGKAKDLPESQKDLLGREAGELRQAVSEARAAVERKDRAAVREPLARLAAGEPKLQAKEGGGSGGGS